MPEQGGGVRAAGAAGVARELDADGSEGPRLITDQLGPGCGLNGMDWGPDDRLYGPRPAASEVARVDVDRGTFETVASGFDRPVALKFDSQHRLHVLDSGTGELFRVDIANGEKELVGRTGAGSDNLSFDADDRLFVSSYTHGFIVEVLGPESSVTTRKMAISRRRFLKRAGVGVGAGAAAAVAPAGPSALVGEAAAAAPDPDIRLAPESSRPARHRCRSADRVWEHTAEAFRQMKTGIPQSTHLIFPSDVPSTSSVEKLISLIGWVRTHLQQWHPAYLWEVAGESDG